MGSRLRICLLVAALAFAPAASYAEIRTAAPPSAAAMGFDMLLVRPLGLVSTVAGTGLFVVSLPFSILGLNADDAAVRLVGEPAKFTFVRPLGEFGGTAGR